MSMWADVDSPVEARQALLDLLDALVDEDGYPITAPCHEAPDEWFPGKGDQANYQKDVCAMLCPAQAQCLAYALIAGEKHGVWGAVSSPGVKRAKSKNPRSRRHRAA